MKLSATRELIMEVEEHYPTTDTKELAERLGITTNQLRHIVRVNGIRKTQVYKMAGNSIVVHQLHAIFEQMFYPIPQRGEQLTLFQ